MLIKNFLEERKVFMLSLHMGSAPADSALWRILFMAYLWKNISTGVIRYVSCVRLSKPLWGLTKWASVCFPCRETEARGLAGERKEWVVDLEETFCSRSRLPSQPFAPINLQHELCCVVGRCGTLWFQPVQGYLLLLNCYIGVLKLSALPGGSSCLLAVPGTPVPCTQPNCNRFTFQWTDFWARHPTPATTGDKSLFSQPAKTLPWIRGGDGWASDILPVFLEVEEPPAIVLKAMVNTLCWSSPLATSHESGLIFGVWSSPSGFVGKQATASCSVS